MEQPAFLKQLKFATGNLKKLEEARSILRQPLIQVSLELEEVQTCDVETAARHKAEAAFRQLGEPVLVEDSGLVINAWNGLPGALVKWFENTVGLAGMARMLDGFESREAVAQCLVALHDGRRVLVARGEVTGEIAPSPRGNAGFGWDVLFIPQGEKRTFAEMSSQEKNAISHRRHAFTAMQRLLDGPLGQGRKIL
ncbi:MAG: RdgB/HAM1 family non-canonical purine NTP pyrophosphatase [Nitrospinaceae bacterium]